MQADALADVQIVVERKTLSQLQLLAQGADVQQLLRLPAGKQQLERAMQQARLAYQTPATTLCLTALLEHNSELATYLPLY